MIRVLNLFTTLDNGGVESFLLNYYTHMNRNLIQYDFVVPGEKIGFLEERFIKMGCNVFHVPTFHQNPITQIYKIAHIIKNGQYDIVHCHGYKSAIGLILGKIEGVNTRIIHSHMAYEDEDFSQKLIKVVVTFIINQFATVKLACGIDAARWLFGEKSLQDGQVTVVNNAINIHDFLFDIQARNKIRKSLNIENDFVIGNVARLSYQKNQEFLLEVIGNLSNKIPNIKLIFVGNGEDYNILKGKVRELDIEDKVIFLGIRKDVKDLLSAFDAFVLPSRYEGLPVVLAEAQASGVPSLVSDQVTQEIKVTNQIEYIPLNVAKWEIELIKLYRKRMENIRIRLDEGEKMLGGAYDIEFQVLNLMKIYRKEATNAISKS